MLELVKFMNSLAIKLLNILPTSLKEVSKTKIVLHSKSYLELGYYEILDVFLLC